MSRPLILLLVNLLLAICVSACSPQQSSTSPPFIAEVSPSQIMQLATDQVQAAVNAAKGMEFRNQKGQCGEVNIRNSAGSDTGFQRFVAGSALVVFERDSGIPTGEFEQIWAQLCL